MKHLSDSDLEKMRDAPWAPADEKQVKNVVRRELRLSTRIPEAPAPTPTTVRLDLHQHTEEQAWEKLTALINPEKGTPPGSKSRRALVITGASGILKTKFQDWMQNSILAPRIISWHPLNNGSFEIRIKK